MTGADKIPRLLQNRLAYVNRTDRAYSRPKCEYEDLWTPEQARDTLNRARVDGARLMLDCLSSSAIVTKQEK